MDIVVNGEARKIEEGATLQRLVESLSLPMTRVAVERNRAIVRKGDFGTTALADGDRIEIVTFVGGG